jgi:hypothetical protein
LGLYLTDSIEVEQSFVERLDEIPRSELFGWSSCSVARPEHE